MEDNRHTVGCWCNLRSKRRILAAVCWANAHDIQGNGWLEGRPLAQVHTDRPGAAPSTR
jgi:hypothetical protein